MTFQMQSFDRQYVCSFSDISLPFLTTTRLDLYVEPLEVSTLLTLGDVSCSGDES